MGNLSHIEIAMAKRGRGFLRITEEALCTTVAAREGTAFINGLFIGNLANLTEAGERAVKEEEKPVVIRKRSTMLAHTIYITLLLLLVPSTYLTARAIGWLEADTLRQGETITAVDKLKSEGWSPTPYAQMQYAGEGYNRINGRKR